MARKKEDSPPVNCLQTGLQALPHAHSCIPWNEKTMEKIPPFDHCYYLLDNPIKFITLLTNIKRVSYVSMKPPFGCNQKRCDHSNSMMISNGEPSMW